MRTSLAGALPLSNVALSAVTLPAAASPVRPPARGAARAPGRCGEIHTWNRPVPPALWSLTCRTRRAMHLHGARA